MPRRRVKKNPLPKAPAKRRFAGQPSASPRELQSSLARVRGFAAAHERTERPFDPSRAPSWRGSSRDLVVNGYAEKDIVCENDKAWVLRDSKRNRYTVFRVGVTASTSDSSYPLTPDGLSLAKARCDYLGRGSMKRNGAVRMYVGDAYALRHSSGNDWERSSDDDWYKERVDKTQTSGAMPVGDRLIDGEEYTVFMNTYDGDRKVYYYAQLTEDVSSGFTAVLENGDDEEEDSVTATIHGEGAARFAKRELQSLGGSHWEADGSDFAYCVTQNQPGLVEELEAAGVEVDDSQYTPPDDMERNAAVDPRDIPAHLHVAEINEEPEHNGQDIGYSQGYGSKKEPGWYQVEYATGSDYSGGGVNESNYRVLAEMLGEHHPEDAQPVVWARTSGGHGTYGIVVRYGDLEEEVREAIDALEDYPLMDEEDHSNLEMEQQNEAWEDWGRKELRHEVEKASGLERDALEESLTDDEWWKISRLAEEKGPIYWEDQSGAGQWIDMKKVAKQVVKLLEGSLPSYTTNEQADAYEKLAAAINSAPQED